MSWLWNLLKRNLKVGSPTRPPASLTRTFLCTAMGWRERKRWSLIYLSIEPTKRGTCTRLIAAVRWTGAWRRSKWSRTVRRTARRTSEIWPRRSWPVRIAPICERIKRFGYVQGVNVINRGRHDNGDRSRVAQQSYAIVHIVGHVTSTVNVVIGERWIIIWSGKDSAVVRWLIHKIRITHHYVIGEIRSPGLIYVP